MLVVHIILSLRFLSLLWQIHRLKQEQAGDKAGVIGHHAGHSHPAWHSLTTLSFVVVTKC